VEGLGTFPDSHSFLKARADVVRRFKSTVLPTVFRGEFAFYRIISVYNVIPASNQKPASRSILFCFTHGSQLRYTGLGAVALEQKNVLPPCIGHISESQDSH
jgi:hypothetical protein